MIVAPVNLTVFILTVDKLIKYSENLMVFTLTVDKLIKQQG